MLSFVMTNHGPFDPLQLPLQYEAAPDVLLFPNKVLNNFLTANILVLIHDTGK